MKKVLYLLRVFWGKYKWDVLVVILLVSTFPIYFYKLGQSSLGNWDEAWYADIARNILRTGDLFNLVYNGQPFSDHPPLVMWLIAASFKIFGISELSVRGVSAVMGIFGLIMTYLLGKEISNRAVGFASAVGLTSAVWYVYRARSGNLDIALTLLFITSFYLAFKALKNRRYFVLLGVSLGMLFISKATLPFTIIPSLIVIFWRSKYRLKDYLLLSLFSGAAFILWFLSQLIQDLELAAWYISHGERGFNLLNGSLDKLTKMKEYLHSGIGKWFWPGLLGLILGVVFRDKKVLAISIFVIVYFLPFNFSSDGQIWHLIPLYPFLILLFFSGLSAVLQKTRLPFIVITVLLLLITLSISYPQAKRNWYQFIDIPSFVSDEAILSEMAGGYPYRYFIDGDFDPVATFYSDKPVQKIFYNDLIPLFAQTEPFLLITNQGRLDGANINPQRYQVLGRDRDKILILRR